ncbi:hypothetical protein WMY93_019241 [Mugilogobius chulae]|uniref:Uncharacterized protein n=1 Tax=Mugilogobius chulae TaxID=88201 RepID=A0AAW0NF01_9GOBI
MDRVIPEAIIPLVLHTVEVVVLMRTHRLTLRVMEVAHSLLRGRPTEEEGMVPLDKEGITDSLDQVGITDRDLKLPPEDPTVGMEDSLRGDIMDIMRLKVMCPLA